jgi:hypothetical protein
MAPSLLFSLCDTTILSPVNRWHVAVSLGFYFLITLTAYDRVVVLGKHPQLLWYVGAVPYVHCSKQGKFSD